MKMSELIVYYVINDSVLADGGKGGQRWYGRLGECAFMAIAARGAVGVFEKKRGRLGDDDKGGWQAKTKAGGAGHA
jgi:hypothetical protein